MGLLTVGGEGGPGGSWLAPPPQGRRLPALLRGAHSPMAPDPSGRLGLPLQLLLLLTCCLAATRADLLDWLWSTNTDPPTTSPVPVATGSPPVQPTEATTTQVAPQDGPTEQGTAPTSPELPLEILEAGQSEASTARPASPASPDTKEENLAGVGAMILNVAMGIRSFVQLWGNSTPAENATGMEMPTLATPTGPLTFPVPSSAPQENGTTSWLTSGALSSPDTKRTEAGSLPVPTQPLPSPDRPRTLLGEPSVPPKSPGRALSSMRGGALPWGSQQSPAWPPDLDGKGLLPGILERTPLLLPLVMGSLGAHAAPSAGSSDAPANLSPISLSASTGDRGAWVPHGANSVGPGLADYLALLRFPRPTPTVQPARHLAGRCLPLPPSLPVCGSLGIGRSWLPNHLHHSSGEEVLAAARAWGGLLRTHCHRFLAWFFCLLLAPPCATGSSPSPPPCRQFCEALEDACWSHLDGGRLPVACASLPSREDGHCVFIGPAAGNAWPTRSTLSVLLFPGSPARAGVNLAQAPLPPVLAFVGPQEAGVPHLLGCGEAGSGSVRETAVRGEQPLPKRFHSRVL